MRNCELLWEYYKICDALGDFCEFANGVFVHCFYADSDSFQQNFDLPGGGGGVLVLI